ncbi:MAG: hypothetical protein IJ711_00095 [Lachnospiraceae bacterium]|nr:hypothetical protein [Lachnospiraceae bacterium]
MATCGKCKNCHPIENCAGADCECKAKSDSKITFEVSQDDDIKFYGDRFNEPCSQYAAAI